MYQRPHTRSAHPAHKPSRFARLPGTVDVAPLIDELRAVVPPRRADGSTSWLPSQWKWHLHTYFVVLRGGPPTGAP
ncbi:MAG: hypothetical protein KC620_10530, partial [Myxococcales bacterium]|nr:hypothetical protein [Myxococcales bacterium]